MSPIQVSTERRAPNGCATGSAYPGAVWGRFQPAAGFDPAWAALANAGERPIENRPQVENLPWSLAIGVLLVGHALACPGERNSPTQVENLPHNGLVPTYVRIQASLRRIAPALTFKTRTRTEHGAPAIAHSPSRTERRAIEGRAPKSRTLLCRTLSGTIAG